MVEAAFYGDDFTGSTDAMVQFARAGLRSVLLVTLPSARELRELAERYDVIGVAGIARSLPPDEQEAELRPVLNALQDLGPRVLQYKVCSTADSSPTRGSIGRALEIGREVCGPAVVPILIAQPELGRYTVFSHHFAAEAGTIHRLDRQPTMSTHPATPMHESDLRRHLSHQTSLPITALHLTAYPAHPTSLPTPDDAAAVLLDALTDEDLRTLGQAIVAALTPGEVRFAIGSGGLSQAIGSALRPARRSVGPASPNANETGTAASQDLSRTADTPSPHTSAAHGPASPNANGTGTTTSHDPSQAADTPTPHASAVDGSPSGNGSAATASPAASGPAGTPTPHVTAVDRPASSSGNGTAPAASPAASGPAGTPTPHVSALDRPASPHASGVAADASPNLSAAVLVVSGSQSSRTAEQIEWARRAGWVVLPLVDGVVGRAVGAFADGAEGVVVHTNELGREDLEQVPAGLAEVVHGVVAATAVRRVVVAGGDTSGQVLRQLGISALELAGPTQPIAPGVHLCRTSAAAPELDGLQVLLKPGQLGEADLFTQYQSSSA
ncbi:four-carbon acid sugar kinase family protein [Kribbella sp. NPDC003557]|uniref:four-carbon acid sugar kinase family protein n=1 Tax=Kribbella sp. NPDC003557 TaxID=3154449 RepID=UPI0033BCB2D6